MTPGPGENAAAGPGGRDDAAGASGDGERARLFAAYLDRLNAGEVLDPAEIRAAHPELAAELIEALRDFEAFGAEPGAETMPSAFGGYRIVRELGRGGMGVVYEALEEAMDRRVALKVLPAGLKLQEKAVVRFRREARIVAQLRHPNIVTVYGTGVVDATPFIAMEFVEGETLDKVLERRRPEPAVDSRGWGSRVLTGVGKAFAAGKTTTVVPAAGSPEEGKATASIAPGGVAGGPAPGDADAPDPIPANTADMDLSYAIRMARTFAAVAWGLQHAHAKGIIHRDLKPSNLILDRGGDQGGSLQPSARIRLLDFGLARLEGQESLTASGEIVGTPRYMSPEQARSLEARVDHRTDIYSLGATLYEVLTLAPPFQGKTPHDTLAQVVGREPRPPRRLNPRVPADLETIVLRCLEKKPEDRYGTAEALAQDLERFARGDPIEARALSFASKMARRVRRHRGKLAVAAALVVLAALAGWAQLARRDEARKRMAAEYDKEVVGAVIKMQMSGVLLGGAEQFTSQPAGYDMMRLCDGLEYGVSTLDLIGSSIAVLEKAAAWVPERADAYYHLGRAWWLLGDATRALEELRLATDRGFLPAMTLAALIREASGDAVGAAALREEAARRGNDTWTRTWLEAQGAERSGRWREAVTALEKLLELEGEGAESYLGARVETYLACGRARLRLGEYDRAGQDFAIAGAMCPGAVEPEIFRAFACHARGEEAEAERRFDKLYERSRSDDVVNLVIMIYGFHFGRYEKALAWAERLKPGHSRNLWKATFLTFAGRAAEALEVARKLPEENPRATLSYFIAGFAFMSSGDFGGAETMLRKASELAPTSSAPHSMLANVFFRQGKMLESWQALEKAVEVEPEAPVPHYCRGLAFKNQGRFEDAVRSLRRALELGSGSSGGIFGTADVLLELVEALQKLGRAEEAAAEFRKAGPLAADPKKLETRWLPVVARAQRAAGDATAACGTVEAAIERAGMDPLVLPALEAQAEEYARAARPDLPSYRACDLALAEVDTRALVAAGATWRYFKGKTSPSTGLEWSGVEFDDAAWESGPGGFGYGDGDDATVLDDMRGGYTTLYVRCAFEVAAPADIRGLTLSVVADDGVIAYLNGKEVLRERAAGEGALAHDAVASANASEPILPVRRRLEAASSLRPGKNVLALQGLNFSASSSDFSLTAELVADIAHDPGRGGKLLEGFRAAARGAPAAVGRLAYVEGRLLERQGKPAEAAARFAAAVELDATRVEPVLALAAALETEGKAAEAEERLRRFLQEQCPASRRVWEEWLRLSLGPLRRAPAALLAGFPCAERAVPGGDDAGGIVARLIAAGGAALRGGAADGNGAAPENMPSADARWLLGELAGGGALRVRCGGGDHVSPDGKRWSRDRFFTSGATYLEGRRTFNGEIAGTADAALYRTERHFPPSRGEASGYRIPLPPGEYRVTLHFAEVYFQRPGARVFDVSIEGRRVLEGFEPLAAGFAAAVVKSFEVEAVDGLLVVELEGRTGEPKLSALEIEPGSGG